MFFSGLAKVPEIAKRAETAVFALELSDVSETGLSPFFVLEPGKNGKISIEAARELIDACTLRQTRDVYIIIRRAEVMGREAQNALLKLLEEPKENYHFLLFTADPTLLLPTILSRAEIYYPVKTGGLAEPVAASEKAKDFGRRLLSASERELLPLAEEAAKMKDRALVLEALAAACEIGYKSYFATGNVNFLRKLPKLMHCFENIKGNGHIKLHIMADLC